MQWLHCVICSPKVWCVHLQCDAFTYSVMCSVTVCVHLQHDLFTYSVMCSPSVWCVHLRCDVFTYSVMCSPSVWCVHLQHDVFAFSMMCLPSVWCVCCVHLQYNEADEKELEWSRKHTQLTAQLEQWRVGGLALLLDNLVILSCHTLGYLLIVRVALS